jgi:predicted transglutaminase-like protease
MKESKILTLHPQGKNGKNIDIEKYDILKENILASLENKELSHNELMNDIQNRLSHKFEGNVSWYAETVKLDLEARNIIERTQSKPVKYRLK